MTNLEITVHVNLGVTPELTALVNAILHKETQPVVAAGLEPAPEAAPAPVEEKPARKPRKTKSDTAAPEAAPASETEAAPVKPAPVEAAPVEEEQKDNITLPDLRLALLRLYAGGENKDITDGIMKQMGAQNLTEIAKDKYDELYKVLISKAEEMGL